MSWPSMSNRNCVTRRTPNSKLHDGEGAEYAEEHPGAFVLFAGQCGSLGSLRFLQATMAAWGTCAVCRAVWQPGTIVLFTGQYAYGSLRHSRCLQVSVAAQVPAALVLVAGQYDSLQGHSRWLQVSVAAWGIFSICRPLWQPGALALFARLFARQCGSLGRLCWLQGKGSLGHLCCLQGRVQRQVRAASGTCAGSTRGHQSEHGSGK